VSDALLLIVGMWVAELLALLVLVMWWLVLDLRRDPPGWWYRRQIPDFVPGGFGGRDAEQTTPDDRPRS
jgi:hypothetical protein